LKGIICYILYCNMLNYFFLYNHMIIMLIKNILYFTVFLSAAGFAARGRTT